MGKVILKMIRAVLFDLDGTLVNTMGDLNTAVNFVLQKHGYKTVDQKDFIKMIGRGNENMIRCALPDEKKNDREYVLSLRDEFFEYYKKHCADKSCLYDGIKELITNLKKEDILLAVVTNKAQIMTDELVPQLFSKNTFEAVIGQRDGVPTKPEPHMPFLAMSEMDVNPDECLFVGDSGVDIETGKNCGNTPVGVTWGYRDRQELINKGARFIVDKPEEILDIIRKINQC